MIGCGVVGSSIADFYENQTNFRVIREDPKYNQPEAYPEIVQESQVAFVCVPTPTVDQVQDLSYVEQVFSKLHEMDYSGIVLLKSTVLPGTCDNLAAKFPKLKLVHSPEFLTADLATSAFSRQTLQESSSLFSGPMALEAAKLVCWNLDLYHSTCLDYRTTEMAKYLHNTFLATKVLFMNEFRYMCEHMELDYRQVRDMAVRQGKIGYNHTEVPGRDGLGYAGACFPKDMAAFITWGDREGFSQNVQLLRLAQERNAEFRKGK